MAAISIKRVSQLLFLCCLQTTFPSWAQTAPQGGADTLLFSDGEKLIGHLVSSNGDSVVFKSDMAGQVTVSWNKIKELHSPQSFAVIKKNANLDRHENRSDVPQGAVSVEEQKLELRSSGGTIQTIPVAATQHLVDEPTFLKATSPNHNIFQDWKSAATVGISLVKATQDSQTYTSSVALSRSYPTVDWINPENRTLINFSSSYGKLSQPGTPTVKTSIYHADAERDEYFSPRLYAFAEAAFDHNFSQGLDLQQTYGGGIGFTLLKSARNELDLKGELDYLDQNFQTAIADQKLVGSVFSENFNHTFKHAIVYHESISISPAWSNTRAYSASADSNLKLPVLKRISVTLDVLDNFLNDPSPGFKKNSFQFTTGLTYTRQ